MCYGIKWLLRQEGARDHVDRLKSLSHQPNFVIVDFANQVAAHGNKRLEGWFCTEVMEQLNNTMNKNNYFTTQMSPSNAIFVQRLAVELCHRFGTPCPECRSELACEIPPELLSARAIHDYGDCNEAEDMVEDDGEELAAAAPSTRMKLRTR